MRILFFDFDDTLYSHTLGCVPQEVLTRLRRLDQAEYLLAVATGRGPESLPFLRSALGFLPQVLALLNGQTILYNGIQVYERFMALPSMDAIIQTAGRHGYAYGGYTRKGVVVSEINDRVSAVWSRFGSPVPEVIADPGEPLRLYQGHLYIKKEECRAFAPLLDDYVINWSDDDLLNLIPKTAGKSQVVPWCLERWPCPPENTYAFGDGFNDVDLISAVGHGVSVGTANPALRAAAEWTAPPAGELGLLRALDHYQIR